MAFFGSSYSVYDLAGGQLRVESAPQYLLASPFLLVGGASALFLFYRMYRMKSFLPVWGLVFWCIPFLFIGFMVMRAGSVTLDRAADTAVVTKPAFFWHTTVTVPLHTIRYADIRTMRVGTFIALVLNNGEAIGFADATQESGQGVAAEAINRYIGSTVR